MLGNSKEIKIKIFEEEEEVNEWLSTVDVEIVDLKFQYDWNSETTFVFVVYKS